MTPTSMRNPVTVVVPVYGDLPSLLGCVESLKLTVDQQIDSVLLVNDCGPDADAIEAALLAAIENEPGFRYERNPRNLGFVGNCNRAALELDLTDNDILLLNSDTVTTPGFIEELSSVLHSAPEHGIVCARSNNATIASLPFRLRDPRAGRNVERTLAVHEALRDSLPRFSVAPVSMGFCFLVRRALITEYGLFDEIFAPGYGEENDFCLRMRSHGFLSLIAHRALVLHVGGLSFMPTRRAQLRNAHERILTARHPGYTEAVQSYLKRDGDPVDVFADCLVPADTTVRLLIDCAGQPTPAELELLSELNGVTEPSLRTTVSVPATHRRELASRFPRLDVIAHRQLDRVWDVSFSAAPAPDAAQLDRLVRSSPRPTLLLAGGSTAGHDARLIGIRRLVPTEGRPADVIAELSTRIGRDVINPDTLRSAWWANAARAREAGIPLVFPPGRGARLLNAVERRSPFLARVLRRVARRG